MAIKSRLILVDFAEWTSIPGPKAMVYTFNTTSLVLWGILLAALYLIFFYQLYLIVTRFFAYPSTIAVTLLSTNRSFPIVTVCNQNPYKLNMVASNANFSDIFALMRDYKARVAGNVSSDADRLGLNASTQYQLQEMANTALLLLANELPEEIRREATYTYSEFVAYCLYNNVPCHRSNFTEYMSPTYGACYQFNAPNGSDFQVYRAGSGLGLVMLIVVKYDPSGVPIYLPTTQLAGLRMRVTYEREDPDMESFGSDIPVGFEVQVSMEMSRANLLTPPYGQCIDDAQCAANPDQCPTSDGGVYSIQNCFQRCKQKHILERCECADPRYSKPPDEAYCMLEDLDCLVAALDIETNGGFLPSRDCDCHPPCQYYEIVLVNTLSNFPPDGSSLLFANDSVASRTLSCEDVASVFAGDLSKCLGWWADNSVLLNVWFDGLDFESNDQSSSYTLLQASAEVGGQMGLWIGTSVINIFEIAFLIAMFVYFLAYGRNVRVVPNEEEYRADVRYRNIQALRNELNAHDVLDDEMRQKIEQQQHERAHKLARLQVEIARVSVLLEQTRQRVELATRYVVENPTSLEAGGALANANSMMNSYRRRLAELREEYDATV